MTSGSDFCNPYFCFVWAFLIVGKKSTCTAGDPNLIPGLGRSAGEGIVYPLQDTWASLVAQLVKNLPAKWETWVWCLGWEDPLEKGKATTPACWPGEFHGLYSPWGHRVGYNWATFTSLHFCFIAIILQSTPNISWVVWSKAMASSASRYCPFEK